MRRYLLSLPERVIRSGTAVGAGLAREIGDVAVPQRVRRTRLYQTMVESTLQFLIEHVGQVQGAYPSEGQLAEDFALRRAAGNGVELIGIIAFRASPVWVLAALADVSGAGRQLIRDITETLKTEGLLDRETNFDSIDQMLDGLEKSAGRLAETINMPPLDVAGLRRELAAVRGDARTIPSLDLPSPDLLNRKWTELKQAAAVQGLPVFRLSSLIALSTVTALPENLRWLSRCARLAGRRTGQIFAKSLLDHYSHAADEIRTTGFLTYWVREFRPYLRAAGSQFSPARRSLTERLLQ